MQRLKFFIENMNNEILKSLKTTFATETLDEGLMSGNPFEQFQHWFNDALNASLNEPNAMVLSTSTLQGKPSSRVVLLKSMSEDGFIFFTNYESRKGHDLLSNPQASLLFYWAELGRQIRIEGTVSRVSISESEEYFHSRPRQSQIGAIVSKQSQIITSREQLENDFFTVSTMYEGKEIPLPETWGGYCLNPNYFEFWQGRENRLHDRIIYNLNSMTWSRHRLSP